MFGLIFSSRTGAVSQEMYACTPLKIAWRVLLRLSIFFIEVNNKHVCRFQNYYIIPQRHPLSMHAMLQISNSAKSMSNKTKPHTPPSCLSILRLMSLQLHQRRILSHNTIHLPSLPLRRDIHRLRLNWFILHQWMHNLFMSLCR